jgi:hypothetical protein
MMEKDQSWKPSTRGRIDCMLAICIRVKYKERKLNIDI